MTFAITGYGAPKLPLNYITSVCREQERTVDQIKLKNIFFFQIFVKKKYWHLSICDYPQECPQRKW